MQFGSGLEPSSHRSCFGAIVLSFEQSRCLLIGKPKIGKSHWLCVFWSHSLQLDNRLCVNLTRPCQVTWLQAEIIQEFLKSRSATDYQPYMHDLDLMAMGPANLIPTGR